MAELYRHTDEDGDTVTLETEGEGECSVNIYSPNEYAQVQLAVYLDEGAGRRLIDALLRYYGPKDSTDE